jgi:hypothetical protein
MANCSDGKSGGTASAAGQTPVIISGGITKGPIILEFSERFTEDPVTGKIEYSLPEQRVTRIEVFIVDESGNETLLLKLDSDGISNNPRVKIYYEDAP